MGEGELVIALVIAAALTILGVVLAKCFGEKDEPVDPRMLFRLTTEGRLDDVLTYQVETRFDQSHARVIRSNCSMHRPGDCEVTPVEVEFQKSANSKVGVCHVKLPTDWRNYSEVVLDVKIEVIGVVRENS